MALYQKQFTKPYPGGYVDKPQKTTPVTAEILNMQDDTFTALEDFLTSDDVTWKKALTIGQRTGHVGAYSFAMAYGEASESYSFAGGNACKATELGAHAEGNITTASKPFSHAEGNYAIADGAASHVEGSYTIAKSAYQHVQGKYNAEDNENKYAHIVGGGTSDTNRKNIHTLDWQGNAVFAGDVTNGNGVSLDGIMALIGTTGQLRTIVETLPEEDISTSTIYMVPKESGGENDIYNEYINVDGTPEGWEFIGNSAVDLSDYYTKSQVDEILTGYVPAESGKGLSSNDYTEADKELVDSIKSMTAEDAMAILNEEAA